MRAAIEAKLRRRTGASAEASERLRDFNHSQIYRGQCRKCKHPWKGSLEELPRQCVNCGLGGADGD